MTHRLFCFLLVFFLLSNCSDSSSILFGNNNNNNDDDDNREFDMSQGGNESSSMNASQLFEEEYAEDANNIVNHISEASFTLDEVMEQKSMANLVMADAAAAVDAADVEPSPWWARAGKHLKKMWDETEQEMNSMDNMANSSNQMSSQMAHESSRNMAPFLMSGKTKLYVCRSAPFVFYCFY
jgi:hypothetical protein